MCQNIIRIRNLLKTHFVHIKHIEMRRIIDHFFFVSTQYLRKIELRGFDARLSLCTNIFHNKDDAFLYLEELSKFTTELFQTTKMYITGSVSKLSRYSTAV